MNDTNNENATSSDGDDTKAQQRGRLIVKAYPFALIGIGVVLNLFVLGINPLRVAMPAIESIYALIIVAALLVTNHTWLMTATELTRSRFRMYATPEEWAESSRRREDVTVEGLQELERHHNAHRNTTENTVYFVFLALIFVLVSPPAIAAYIWLVTFPIARLGYTYSYLTGKDGVRGLFMSLSLLSVYGMAGYLVVSLFL